MAKLPWIVGGGAVAAYFYARGRKKGPRIVESQPAFSVPQPTPFPVRQPETPMAQPTIALPPPLPAGAWVWPVATWKNRVPVVSDGVGSPRPEGRTHRGVDIMFVRQATDELRPGTPNGSAGHVMPDNVLALAASDGVVWSAEQTPRGFAVTIDHGPQKLATYYTHLEKLLVALTTKGASKQRVKAGDPIGVIGFDPLDPQRLKHLHFEMWRGGPNDAIDPHPLMKTWTTVPDPRGPSAIRNAGLVYRPVGATGEPYPEWVRALKGKAGVYIIREIDGEIVYVGSSAGRLYDTLTRHFQTWRRWKGYWKGQYAEGHDPGLTYRRSSVEVAIRLTSPNDSLDEEMRLIRRLKPRDNLIGQPELEEVPF